MEPDVQDDTNVLSYAPPPGPAAARRMFSAGSLATLSVFSAFIAWLICASASRGIADHERVTGPLMISTAVAFVWATTVRIVRACRRRMHVILHLGLLVMVLGATALVARAAYDLWQAW